MPSRLRLVSQSVFAAGLFTAASLVHAQWTGAGAGGSATDISSSADYTGGATSLGNLGSITTSVSTLDMSADFTTGTGGLDLRFANPGTAVSIGDGSGAVTLKLAGNILLNRYLAASAPSASTITFGSEITLDLNGANRTFSGTNSGTGASATPSAVVFNGTVALGGNNLNVSSGTVTFNGLLTGTGSLTYGGLSGVGTVTLTNSANSFTGGVGSGGFGSLLVNATTVLANTGSNSALGAGGNIGFGNATNITLSGFTAAQSTNRTISAISNASLVNNGANSVTLAGSVVNNSNNGTFTFSGNYNAASGSNVVSGQIADGTKTLGINVGGSVWSLTNDTNSYTLATSVGSGGVLEFTSVKNVGAGASSLGAPADATAGTITIGAGGAATLRFIGTAASSSDRVIQISDNGSSNNYTITANGGTGATLAFTSGVLYNGTAQADKNRPLFLDGTNTGANTLGNIAFNYSRTSGANGNASITKNGTGTWVLAGTNAYTLGGGGTAGTFTTTVNAGTLFINGDHGGGTATASTLTVNRSATGTVLAGAGTIRSTTAFGTGAGATAELRPGATANSLGTLTFTASLSLANATGTVLDIGASSGVADQIVTAAALTYGGALTLNFNALLPGGGTFDLFNASVGPAGSFSGVSVTGAYLGTLTNSSGTWSGVIGGQTFTFTQSTGDLGVTSAIPEPAAGAAATAAAALLLAAVRRRKKAAS